MKVFCYGPGGDEREKGAVITLCFTFDATNNPLIQESLNPIIERKAIMRTSTKNLLQWLRRAALLALAVLLGLCAMPAFLRHSGEQPQTNPHAQPGRISAEEAMALALNNLTPVANGFQLEHPRHLVQFTETGVRFTPRHGGPEWRWQLQSLGAESAVLQNMEQGPAPPHQESNTIIRYPRGGIEEQYVIRKNSIEQQFVIPQPLELAGENLVITGKVESAGAFEQKANGWQWRDEQGGVTLGNVAVFDANGAALPANMQVTATETRIEVEAAALASAEYPVTIDPEIGANDFRISDLGPDGNTAFDAFEPAVAYNSANNEYLVVWAGDDDTAPLVDNEVEIFGQRINAATGAEVGSNDFRISDVNQNGDPLFSTFAPAVVYNSVNNEYLVVWEGHNTLSPLVAGESEIYGQRLNAATGAEVGDNDFRLSDMGPAGNIFFHAFNPAAIYNSTDNEYLVVWQSDDDTAPLVEGETEIFGQRLNAATGAEVGSDDFRISDMGPDGNIFFHGSRPAVIYNGTDHEYLVVWEGTDDTAPLVEGETEIFGQRLDAATGGEVGSNDFRISDMGPDGNVLFDATDPAVAYNSTDNEYLVVWAGNDDTVPLVVGESEIYGQRLNAATGAEVGSNDFRISDMGPDGNGTFDAEDPAVAYNSTDNEYLVVWVGDDITTPLVDEEDEIFGQRLNAATGAEVGDNDFRLSDMGPDGNASFDADEPAVAYNSTNNEYLAVWEGDDDTAPLVDEENEIFGQRFANPAAAKPFVFLANKVTLKRTKQSTPSGDIHSNGTLTVEKGDPSAYNSNLTAVGKITIQKDNTINGDVTSQTSISNSGTINGTKSVGPVDNEPLPSLSYSAGGSNKTVPSGGSLAVAPGSYNLVTLNSGGTLKLTSGEYFMNELRYSGSTAVIEIDLSSGNPVIINVVSKLQLGKEVEIRLLSNGEDDSELVTFNTLQSAAVSFGKEAYLLGSFNAPNAKVTLVKNSQLRGSICANEILIERDCLFLHHDSPGSLPGPGNLPKSAVDEDEEATSNEQPVTSYQLEQNYPNPFNPSTVISFQLAVNSHMTLKVFDVNGREVARLVDGEKKAGQHQIAFDAVNLPSGVYFVEFSAGLFRQIRKAVLLR
jgi:hypothetical protein